METFFAIIDDNNVVLNIISATPEYVESRVDKSKYVQTWLDANTKSKRHNYAMIGGKYDTAENVFIDVQPYKSWKLNNKFQWEAPTPVPEDGKRYVWDEPNLSWSELPPITVR